MRIVLLRNVLEAWQADLRTHNVGDARYNQRNSFFEVPCDAMRMQVNFRQCGEQCSSGSYCHGLITVATMQETVNSIVLTINRTWLGLLVVS